jgi:Zn-dependent protease with chaperone function
MQIVCLLTHVVLCCLLQSTGTPEDEGNAHLYEIRPTAIHAEEIDVPEPTPQAVSFHESGHWIWLCLKLWSIAVPFLLFVTSASARLRTWSIKWGRHRLPAGLLFGVAYLALTTLLALPINYLIGFVRMHMYGLSHESLASWAIDEAKELALLAALACPGFVVVNWLIGRLPKTWWLACGVLSLPVIVALTLAAPVWIDPLFHEFHGMKDKALEARILQLAARAGIDVDRVFEVDMSRKTTSVNAYVTGLLGTKRIVLWDTLLEKLEPSEVLSVMGHEMGHFVLNHVVQGVLLASLLVTIGLGLTHMAATGVLPRLAPLSRVSQLSDFGALPLLISVGSVVGLALVPLGYAYSRHIEREADRFSLELLRDNAAAARAFVSLQRENLGYPRPGAFYQILRSTHPSLGERVDFCNNYRPWERGEPLRYGDLIQAQPHKNGSVIPRGVEPHL